MSRRRVLRVVGSLVGLWVALEVAVRYGGAILTYFLLGDGTVGAFAALLLGVPLVAYACARYARPTVTVDGYALGPRVVLGGVASGVLALAGMAAGLEAYRVLFGPASADAGGSGSALAGAPVLAAVYLLGNGVAVPVSEEYVWRGLVQPELVASAGAVPGVLATAALFSAKHVVVDLSATRALGLLAFGVVLGVARHWWGPASSTVGHVVANLVASAYSVGVAFA